MTTQRPLSPFESTYFGTGTKLGSVPTGGMPLYLGSTVHGGIDVQILRRVLDELAAAHPLLRSRVVTAADGAHYFDRDDEYRPRLDITDGDEAAYLNLVNGPRDWADGLFRAHLLRDGERERLVLVIHHGISDGRSGFALLGQLWQRYTAHSAGNLLPQDDSDQTAPEAMDTQLAEVISSTDVDEFLEFVRAGAAMMGPESAPRTLPHDGDGVGNDPLGRFAVQRIELDTRETDALVATARAHDMSVNSLLTGAAVVAFRTQLAPETGPLPMLCGHAVDVRGELVPPLPASTMVNCASGVGTPMLVDPEHSPLDLGRLVTAAMQDARDRQEAGRFLLAAQRAHDPGTAALFAAAPTLAISNIGRLPAHSMPQGLRHVRDDISAMGPGMPPKLTIFTVGDRLTVQVEYDTAYYSRATMGKIALALLAQLRRYATTRPSAARSR
ncbi:phthiocerol/phthiodiolone dimycocerosyl transferase family protein [Nocardia altamirensis]|uniref:phthiocerol/phthiodiolone dimycocerosyl transferase family protein n=1 Tax=Nocardia altamirensis TaxID=472158 RepID=UPI0008405A5F|nr:condensation domain-containing protein [Nocardia altamirensis]